MPYIYGQETELQDGYRQTRFHGIAFIVPRIFHFKKVQTAVRFMNNGDTAATVTISGINTTVPAWSERTFLGISEMTISAGKQQPFSIESWTLDTGGDGGGGSSGGVSEYYVKDFGAKVDGSTNDTTAVQNAINTCANDGGGKVILPAGTCCVTSIYMRENVTIEGASVRGTVLKALTSTAKGLITADYPQPIHRACVRKMTLDGGWLNDGQGGLYMDATQQTSSPYTGGVWYSHFELLHINGFKGPCIYSRAINGQGDLANQFLEFRQITAYRYQDATGCCLKMIGQLGQATFYQCEFSTSAGGQQIAGSNVQLGRDTTAADPTEADQTPMAVLFMTCTFQNSAEAVNIRRCANIYFYNCWLENIGKGFTIWESPRQIGIRDTHFANACSDGSGTGYGVKATGNATASVTGSYFFGAIDVPVWDDTAYGIYVKDNRIDGTYTGPLTKGFTKQISLSGNTLNTDWHRDILLNATNADLTTINSKLGPDETLTVRAWNLGKYIRLVSGGNILIRQPLYLKHGEYVTFKYSDMPGASGWEMIGTSQRELRTSDINTDASGQYFIRGEMVHNLNPLSNGYAGWTASKAGKFHGSGGNATMTQDSPNITFNDAVTYKWAVGDEIIGTGIPAGTTILSLTGNSAVLSANCTQTASSVTVYDVQFIPFGRVHNPLTLSGTETTFSAAGIDKVYCNQSGASTITSITGGIDGYDIELIGIAGNTTIAHNSAIRLKGGVNVTIPADGSMRLVYYAAANKWIEV